MASLCAPIFAGSWITIETARNVSVSQLRNNDHMIRIIGEREGVGPGGGGRKVFLHFWLAAGHIQPCILRYHHNVSFNPLKS